MFTAAETVVIHAVAADRGYDGDAVVWAAHAASGGAARQQPAHRMATPGDGWGRNAGRRAPLRFEPHVFHRRLPHALRARALAEGLAARRAGEVVVGDAPEAHARLYARAARLDAEAAAAACAWGVGGVMGEHAALLGFGSAVGLANHVATGLAAEIDLMLREVERRELGRALHARDWAAFAAGYRCAAGRSRFAALAAAETRCATAPC